jgi:mannitol/fructose-specific phosphotransferase system IIA component (Ntr-type)
MNTSGPGAVVLSALLSTATIKLSLTSTHRDEVLRELVGQLPDLAKQPDARQSLLRALLEREQLHSTGIGSGIALPHARNALAGIVDHPIIVFGRHSKGIAFGAADGIPARLFFMLIAPTVQQHLAVLARISRLLRDVKLRDDLLVADTPDKIIALIRESESRM